MLINNPPFAYKNMFAAPCVYRAAKPCATKKAAPMRSGFFLSSDDATNCTS